MNTVVADKPQVHRREAVLGHLALHYLPGDEGKARRLLELIGCTLVDNGPSPGSDGFCTVLVNADDANYADNIMFLSAATSSQVAVEKAVREAFPDGVVEGGAVDNYRQSMLTYPESTSHIGIRFGTLEKLEQVLAAIDKATARGGELEGRAKLVKYLPRPGDDPSAFEPIIERMGASPVFSGQEAQSFAPYWVQCFLTTDLCGFGILAFGSIFELDFVFEPFLREPPVFGRSKVG